MAYVQNTRALPASGVSGLLNSLGERVRRYRVYRSTLNELSMLNDRELNDLGLSRTMVRSIAYRAAYQD